MTTPIRTRLARLIHGKLGCLAGAGWPSGAPNRARAFEAADEPDRKDTDARSEHRTTRQPITPAVDAREADALAILELQPQARADEVRAAYKRLCKRYHPDRFAGDPTKTRIANELLTRINGAYQLLMARRR